MNKLYRLVWSDTHETWIVCSKQGARLRKSSLKSILLLSPLLCNFTYAADCAVSNSGLVTNTLGPNLNCDVSTFQENIQANPWSVGMIVYGKDRSITVLNNIESKLKLGTGISVYSAPSVKFDAKNKEIKLTILNTDAAPSNGDANEKIGLNVNHGALAEIGTLDLTMKNLPKGRYHHYGVLAGSTVSAGEQSTTNGIYSKAIFDNLNIDMGSSNYSSGYPLLAGIRAIQGASNNSGNGSSGYVEVKNQLNINIENTSNDAAGIYISGTEKNKIVPEVRIHNSDIKITSTSSRANAILLGKNANVGTGEGRLYSTGKMILDTVNAKNSSAISIIWQGAHLDANTSTSTTIIRAGKEAININGSALQSVVKTITTFNNLVIDKTATNTANLIKVKESQLDYEFSANGNHTKLVANTGANAYLIDVEGRNSTASHVTFNLDEGYMQGLTNKTTDSDLDINLSKNAVWQLHENASGRTAKFSNLNVDNGQINATLLDNTQNALSNFTLQGDVYAKNSQINLNNSLAGDMLTIDGNYESGNNTWKMDSYLTGQGQSQITGDGKSYTDKLMIKGNATTGSKGADKIFVNNIATQVSTGLEDILVVEVVGQSNAEFVLGQRVVSGAYEYLLEKDINGSWYLSNFYRNPTPANLDPEAIVRPELGGFLANSYGANNLFVHRLEDRMGASQYVNNNDDKKQLWFRAQGGTLRFKDETDQLNTDAKQYLIHAGIGLAEFGKKDQFNAGVMGAWGTFDSDTVSEITGYSAKGTAKGYGLGVYGTWFETPLVQKGKYLDVWAMWNSFDNEVNGETLDTTKYKSEGLVVSLEVGDTFNFSKRETSEYWIQPQAQVVYQNVQVKDFFEKNGTHVTEVGANIQTRIGAKLFKESAQINAEKFGYRPYIALSWLNNSNAEKIELNEVAHHIAGAKNVGELKVGIETRTNKKGQIWANLAYQQGMDSYKNLIGNVGMKWNF